MVKKKDGIYPIRQESIADTYAKAKVFQWQDFSFAYEDQQGRIYYNPTSGERSNGIYALYLTVADSLKGSTATVSSLFSPEVGGETHIVIDSGENTVFPESTHTCRRCGTGAGNFGIVVAFELFLCGCFLLAFYLHRQDGNVVLIRYRFDGLTVYHLVFIQESQDLRFLGCGMVCLYMGDLLMQNAGIVFCISFLQLPLHWQN